MTDISPLEQLLSAAQTIYDNKIPVGDLSRFARLCGAPTRETYSDLDTRETPQVMGVAGSTVASLALGVCERDGKACAILQRRSKERQYFDKGPYGLFGGFVNNGEAEEQFADGCIRKTLEYTTVSNGEPGSTERFKGLELKASQLKLKKALIDYDHVGGEPRSTSTFVSVATCVLTPDQVGYIEGLDKAIKGGLKVPGVEGYDIVPLSEVAKPEFSSKFTHPFAYETVKALNQEVERGLIKEQSLEVLLGSGAAGIASGVKKQTAQADAATAQPVADAPISPQLAALVQAAAKIYPGGKVPLSDFNELSRTQGQDPKHTYGFSTIDKPLSMGVPVSTIGSFTFGAFEKNGTPYVVLQHRDEARQYFGKGPYGIWGGFVDNGDGREQPTEACVREAREETTSAGSQRFGGLHLEAAQLTPRAVFMDYDHTGGEPRSTSTAVSVFGCLLNQKQVQYMTDLGKAMNDDHLQVSEVDGYEIMPLREAAKLPPEKFTHAFAYDAIQTLSREVAQGQSLETLLGNSAGKAVGR